MSLIAQTPNVLPRVARSEEVAVNAKNRRFGAVGDGATDDRAAIQAAIDWVAGLGGGTVYLPPGTYAIGTGGLSITARGVKLRGAGAGFFNPSTGAEPATILKYVGVAGGDVLTVASVSGVGNNKITGCGVIGLGVDGNALAARGVVIQSVNESEFALAASGCTSVQLEVGTVAALADARDPQMNLFHYVRVRATGAQNGILMDCGVGANVSLNEFGYLYAQHESGYGIKLGNTDNNTFENLFASRIGGGTGVGVIFGAADGVTSAHSRGNVVMRCSPGSGGVTAQGTPTAANASADNLLLYLDKENGAADPVIETGATLTWGTNKRVFALRAGMASLTLGDSHDAVTAELPNIGTASVRVRNGSDNHVRLVNGSGHEWSIDIASADGNLRLRRIAGTGVLSLFEGLKVGGGANILRIVSNTATLNFPSVAGAGGQQTLTITVTGAAVGDVVILGLPATGADAGLAFKAWVSAANTVTVAAINCTAIAIDPASATFRATVVGYT